MATAARRSEGRWRWRLRRETSTEEAVEALVALRGIDISIASAILAAIYPERYEVLDYRALEALGHARHDVEFYAEYKAFSSGWRSAGW